MRLIYLFVILMLAGHISFAQNSFFKYYGNTGEYANITYSHKDGGYVIFGRSDAGSLLPGAGNEITLVKTDSTGKPVWSGAYGKDNGDNIELKDGKPTPDGGYIMTCNYFDFGSPSSNGGILVMKTDNNGNLQWEKVFGKNVSAEYENTTLVDTLSDGSFLIGGNAHSSLSQGQGDIYLLRLDPVGDTIWTKVYGGTSHETIYSLAQTDSGAIIVGGTTTSWGEGNDDVYLLKLNGGGDTVWTRTYGTADLESTRHITYASNGDVLIVGTYSPSGGVPGGTTAKIFMMRVDWNGNLLWSKVITGKNGVSDNPVYVKEYAPDKFVIGALMKSLGGDNGNPSNFASLYIDGNGNVEYALTRYAEDVYMATARSVADSGLIFSGNLNYFNFGIFEPKGIVFNTGPSGTGSGSCFEQYHSSVPTSSLSVQENGTATVIGSGSDVYTSGVRGLNITMPSYDLPAIDFTAGSNDAYVGQSNGLAWITNQNSDDTISYDWSGSTDSIFFRTNLAAGTYTVYMENNYGCKDTANITVGETNAPATFQRLYSSGSANDRLIDIQQSDDGGLITAGLMYDNSSGKSYPTLLKLDAAGNIEWQKEYKDTNNILPEKLLQYDQHFYIAGRYLEFGGISDLFVIKTDLNGDTIWTNRYGTSLSNVLYDACITDSGGVLMVGTHGSDGLMIKIDSAGDVLWNKKTDLTAYSEEINAVIPTQDSGFIIGGKFANTSPSDYVNYLLKIDKNGNPFMGNIFDEDGSLALMDIEPASGGGYLVTGRSGVGSNDVRGFYMKVNDDLIPVWTRYYGAGVTYSEGSTLKATPDGGGMLIGRYDPGSGQKRFVMRFLPDGEPYWIKRYGGDPLNDSFESICEASDGGFALAGNNNSFNGINQDGYIVKIDAEGNSGGCYENTINVVVNDSNFFNLSAVGLAILDNSSYANDGYFPTPSNMSLSITEMNISTTVSVTQPLCFGDDDGTITVSADNGYAPYSYNWSTAETTDSISGLAPGTYTVTVEDFNECSVTDTFIITEPDSLGIAFNTTDILCFGDSAGTVDVIASGGAPGYSYTWSTGDTITALDSMPAGWYKVTVTDTNGCVRTDSVEVLQEDSLALSFFILDESCKDANNGSIDLTVSGGVPTYSYKWENGSPGEDRNSLIAGNYWVTVTDANNCTRSDTVVITEPDKMKAVATLIQPTCHVDSCNGTIVVTPSGGNGGYTYDWEFDPMETDSMITGLCIGEYAMTVYDSKGCNVVFNPENMTLTEPIALELTISSSLSACGKSDGSASVNVSGGSSPYSYSWSSGGNSTTESGLPGGTYYISVTDTTGCTINDSVTVAELDTFPTSITGTNILCNGDSTGSADLILSGGTAPYTFLWSNTETSEDIDSIPAGTYTVMVTDSNLCTSRNVINITEPAAINLTLNSTDISCFGKKNGTLEVVASGGTGGYGYSWETGETTSKITGLGPGTYTISVTDGNNCLVQDSASVDEPAQLIGSMSKTDVTCNGACNGTATITPSGGTKPYTYNWSGVAGSDSMVAGLCPGNDYSVTLTDANACSVTPTVTITEPNSLQVSAMSTDASCGKEDGTASATVSGGITPYDYSWSNGMTTSSISGVAKGEHIITVTDKNGCSKMDTTTVEQAANLPITINTTDVSCFGAQDGAADMTITGGTSPLNIFWSNGKNTQDINSLPGDTFNVFVIDTKGCTAQDTIVINEPSELKLNLQVTDISCNNQNDGQIEAIVSGGVKGYSYDWSTGDSLATIKKLSDGNYILTVTDATNCSITDTATIIRPGKLTASIIKTDVTCKGACDGTATVTPQGGTQPFVYTWSTSPSQSDSTATGLCASTGNYTVDVTDARGCQVTVGANITEPDSLKATVSVADATCGNVDGNATVTATGGTPPFSYDWSNNETSNTATGLADGSYTVKVLDSNNCEVTRPVEIGTTGTPVELCIITVDPTSSHNVLFWERPFGTSIDSFRIYREFAGAGYQQIGSVHYDSLTTFVDKTNNINPNITSYRYKISTVDSCGNESILSSFHETIHLQVAAVAGNVQLNWDNYEGFNFNYYRILRDSTGQGQWEVIDSVTSANTTYTDIAPPQTQVLSYLIEVVKNKACIATENQRATVSTSRSNLKKTTISELKAPVSGFQASSRNISEGDNVSFLDQSVGIVENWRWTFEGGNPSTSTSQHQLNVRYDSAGCYEVKLVVSNGAGKDSLIENCYITVSPVDNVHEQLKDESAEIGIFPNPSRGKFNLVSSNRSPVTVVIYDVSGKAISRIGEVVLPVQVDLSHLPPNLYYVKFISADYIVVKRVSVLR